jgi:hypothetical protein
MLVFGDRVRDRDPRVQLAELRRALADVAGARAGLASPVGHVPSRQKEAPAQPEDRERAVAELARHAELTGALIEAGELAQGLADAERAAAGRDLRGPLGEAAMAVVFELARAVAASWDGTAGPAPDARVLDALDRTALPPSIAMRGGEGFAYYALYPESYLAAARTAMRVHPGSRRVIGIRSIGTPLAAMVAVATGAPLPTTVRPVGDPFRRELIVDPALLAEWRDGRAVIHAVVDEGPGLSGSSFGAVLDVLDRLGVTAECYPGHAGRLGAIASERHRTRWDAILRHPADAGVILDRLPDWIAALLDAPLDGPLEDLSAGAWRARRYAHEAEWPAAVTHLERRKLLARVRGQTWIARFAGLGRHAAHALARARALHAAGFVPEVAGTCHGFLVERWLGDATVLDPRTVDRTWLVERVAAYLAFRVRTLPATDLRGASPAELHQMARRNAGLALGPDAAARITERFALAWLQTLPARPIDIDGCMHAHEWLVCGDRLLKADAIDHHAGHDLVGCQDVAWDLAGAELELGLSRAEAARLARLVEARSGRAAHPELLAFCRVAYPAFQLGRHALALDAAAGPERHRLRATSARYAARLAAALAAPLADQPTATRDGDVVR